MFAKNSFLTALVLALGLVTTVGCSRSGGFKPVNPPTEKQKQIDEKTKSVLNNSVWYFDFAVQSFADEKLKDLGSVRDAEDKSFDAEVSENGRNIFPRTLNNGTPQFPSP